jgi:hypothetical protein
VSLNSRQETTTALMVDERCVVGKRRQWWQTRGNDLDLAAGRQVTQCDGLAALMAAAEGTMAADERGAATADGTDERCLGGSIV